MSAVSASPLKGAVGVFVSLGGFHFFRVQIGVDPLHAMPPDGFRLALINGFDLAAAFSARAPLEDHLLERQVAPLALQGLMRRSSPGR